MTLEENVKIIRVKKEGQQPYRTREIWQYDRGHVLVFEDFGLPETFQVHFAQSADGEAKPQVGQNDTCRLPDEYTQSSGTVYAWVYVADLETGLTKCQIEIPVESRGENTDEEPTPVQESALDQAIAALNDGVTRAETAAEAAEESQGAAGESAEAAEESAKTAEKWAVGKRNGVDVPNTDPAYHNNSKYYAEQAAESERNAGESKDAAAGSEKNAEGWAVGKRNGVDVPNTDPAYHNNSRYYAEQAAGSAEAAGGSAETAEKWAVGKRNGVDVPNTDPAYHNNSRYYAEQAAGSAEAAADTLNRAVETITREKTSAITAVQQKGQETTETITQQKNAAVEAITQQKSAAVTAIGQKGQEVLDSIPADYTELTGDVNTLQSTMGSDPATEETGLELLTAMEENANWTWGVVLALEFLLGEKMPQNETLAEIAAALEDGNDIMEEYFRLVAAERV